MMATDPVCHMSVDEKAAAGKSEYGGKTYYFCCPACKVDPQRRPGRNTLTGFPRG